MSIVQNYSIKHENGLPFTIYEWKDSETDAVGWIAIDGSTPSSAGGGLFMSASATLMEVCDIANTMSNKMCVSRVRTIRGAKGGIRFNHNDPQARNVLRRFLRDNRHILENYWGTGADLNTNHEVIDELCQEEIGIPTALYSLYKSQGLEHETEELRRPLSFQANPYHNLSEASVGYGAAISLLEMLKLYNQDLIGHAKVIIQGFGTVGSTFAYYLHTLGIGQVVGITSIDGMYIDEEMDIIQLLETRHSRVGESSYDNTSIEICLTEEQLNSGCYNKRLTDEDNEAFLKRFVNSVQADVFAPCAGRYCMTQGILDTLVNYTFAASSGYRFIVAGANNIFGKYVNGIAERASNEEQARFLSILADNRIQMLPEWVSNSGTCSLFMLTSTRRYDSDSDVVSKILQDISKDITQFTWNAVRNELPLHNKSSLKLYDLCTDYASKIRSSQLTAPSKDVPISTLKLSTIQHYHLITKDLDSCLPFYRDNFNCTLYHFTKPIANIDNEIFSRQCIVKFNTENDPFIIISESPNRRLEDCGIVYMAFHVQDTITDARKELERNSYGYKYIRQHPLWNTDAILIDQQDKNGCNTLLLANSTKLDDLDNTCVRVERHGQESSLHVKGMDHYTAIVRDADAALRFHVDFLGYRHIDTKKLNVGTAPEGEYDMINYVLGVPSDDKRVLVLTEGLTKESIFYKLLEKKGHSYIHHIAHELDNLENALDRIRKTAYQPTMDKIKNDLVLGLKQIFISDEFLNHFVELVERPTVVSHENLNAIDIFMGDEIAKAVELANYNDDVHCIILTGEGRSFCAGYDLKTFAEVGEFSQGMPWDPTIDYQYMWSNTKNFMSLWKSYKPTIAKVRGHAIAGGSDIALCCDLVVMAEDAKIGYPPARVWGCPTTAMWVYRLGAEKAKRMLLTGDLITGRDAKEMGLVIDAVPESELDAYVEKLANRIAAVPRNQLLMQKMVINQAIETSGMEATQRLATIFDGVARHTPEGIWFRKRSAQVGFKQAVQERDGGEPIAPGVEHKTLWALKAML
ncbi:uncharacterized protein VTP21DRAFT_5056 [Calcarisporiella thermophila]|uniref:uncharacterized protein n=1 Tax=Calcarisporiella thermophila TaxID=911321 RepID=UPI0037423F51